MLGNWIKTTTTTAGSGALTLASVAGYPAFNDVFGVGRLFYYTILNADGTPVESGLGNLTASNTLARLKCLSTYASGVFTDSNAAFVTLGAGPYTVICALDESSAWLAAPSVNSVLAGGNSGVPPANKFLVSSDRSSNSGTTVVNGYIYYSPFRLDVAADVVSMAVNVTTSSAGITANLGIYQVDHRGFPGAKLFETGALSCAATGTVIGTLAASKRLAPGWYYTAIVTSASGPVFRAYGGNGFDQPMSNLVGVDSALSPRTSFSENRSGITLPAAPNPNDYQNFNAVIALGTR